MCVRLRGGEADKNTCWLTVRVQKGEGVAAGNRGAEQSSGDEAFPLSLADDSYDAELL